MLQNADLSGFELIFDVLAAPEVFLAQFRKSPSPRLYESLKAHFGNATAPEMQVLLSVSRDTGDLGYVEELLQANPAHLQDVQLLQRLEPPRVLAALRRADVLQAQQLHEAQAELAGCKQLQERGTAFDGVTDALQVAERLRRRATALTARLTELQKGNCGCFDTGAFWGRTELLAQRSAAGYGALMQFLVA